MSPREITRTRIMERLAAVDLTPRAASMMATGKPDAIRGILAGRSMPSADRLESIANVLGTTSQYLLGTSDSVEGNAKAEEPAPRGRGTDRITENGRPSTAFPNLNRQEMPQDVPVYGTAVGSDLTINEIDNGAVHIEQTDLNTAEVIDYLRRPPALSRQRKIYGLYVAGSSMEPAYEPGAPIFVDSDRSASIRDYVVVYLHDEEDEDGVRAAAALIKRLVRRSAGYVELEQFNPPATFRLPVSRVKAMHRVLPLAEIFGV